VTHAFRPGMFSGACTVQLARYPCPYPRDNPVHAVADGECCPPEFRCVCDPADVFDPAAGPTPRAVAGCPAHRARRAYQLFAEQLAES
jgi:hypothetical protein